MDGSTRLELKAAAVLEGVLALRFEKRDATLSSLMGLASSLLNTLLSPTILNESC